MILEGIVTTWNDDRSVNVAPMGPIVDETVSSLHLRPFATSRTCANLKSRPHGVFHVTDDVLMLAQAAVDRFREPPAMFPARVVPGSVLQGACRWYEFEVQHVDDSTRRVDIRAKVVHAGRLRDFFGFNRAKHAVLEAAILATRVHILPADNIRRELQRLQVPVEKTAGPREREAFALLREFVEESSRDEG